MNKNVVIVWLVAVIIFAAIGLFGMANQHLLDEKPADPSSNQTTNPVSSTRDISCIAGVPGGTSSYKFTVDNTTNKVNRVEITYQASAATDIIQASAQNLSSAQVSGVNFNLSNPGAGFTLLINADLLTYDSASLANYQTDLGNVLAVIGDYDSYDSYAASINNNTAALGVVYTCQ